VFKITYQPTEGGDVPAEEEVDASSVSVGDVWITFSKFLGANQYEMVTMVRAADVERVDQHR